MIRESEHLRRKDTSPIIIHPRQVMTRIMAGAGLVANQLFNWLGQLTHRT